MDIRSIALKHEMKYIHTINMISSFYRSPSFFSFFLYGFYWMSIDSQEREREKKKKMPLIAVLLPAVGVKCNTRFSLSLFDT
jgi:hypothetical protein